MKPVIALQLYTLRDLTSRDMIGTLKKVKEIGYEGVELAGYGNATPEQVAQTVAEIGLKVVGSHVGFGALKEDLGGIVAENQAMNNTFLVCPSIPGDQRSAEGYANFAKELEAMGQQLQGAGFTLCYHNHDWELKDQYDGAMGLDILYDNAGASLLQAEIDTFWVQKGGVNPVEYITKYAGRAPLIHVKDMTDDERETFAEVGEGKMDWAPIFAAAEAGGAKAYIVEQDVCERDPLESVTISLNNLRQMGKLS